MSGPRYDLVPSIEPPLEAHLMPPEPETKPHGFHPGDMTSGKIIFSAAIALLSGLLIGFGLSH